MNKARLPAAGRCAAALACTAQAASLKDLTISTADGPRQAILAVPDSLPPGPHPLVLLLHGHGGTAKNALGEGWLPASPLAAWIAIADREKLLVAALQGSDQGDGHYGWNDCRGDAPGNPPVDDVAFAGKLVQTEVQAGAADPRRVYVMGMSNGGVMSYRLALQMRPRPAAIAAVAASMPAVSLCKEPAPKMSVLMIDGTADPIMPFGGGGIHLMKRARGTVLGAAASRDFWLHADGLDPAAGVGGAVPHLNADDASHVTRMIYGKPGGVQVETLFVDGGGHSEPSIKYNYVALYRHFAGPQNHDLESAEEAWSFFKDKIAE
jgi:polyhydroxybutyrate depolymerase